MKHHKLVFTASLLLFKVTISCSQNNHAGSTSILGTFVASTPCSQGSKPLPSIPANAGCALIKWNLTLYRDESIKSPTTYTLHCVYGLPQQGTTGFIGGGKKIEMEGNWAIARSTASNPNAMVCRLTDNKTHKTIYFLKLGDNLLHLLDSEQHLMIGSSAWSYTLNKITKK